MRVVNIVLMMYFNDAFSLYHHIIPVQKQRKIGLEKQKIKRASFGSQCSWSTPMKSCHTFWPIDACFPCTRFWINCLNYILQSVTMHNLKEGNWWTLTQMTWGPLQTERGWSLTEKTHLRQNVAPSQNRIWNSQLLTAQTWTFNSHIHKRLFHLKTTHH